MSKNPVKENLPTRQDCLNWLAQQRKEMRERYNRVVPTGELFFNRFEKAEYLGAGEGSSIYDSSLVMGDVTIGAHVWVGPFTVLEGINGKLSIGDYVSINTGVSIVTHDSTKHYISGGKAPFKTGDVTIRDRAVIGTMSMIGPGVTIGTCSVIAAHSIVNDDVPDYTIVAGTPARPIGAVQIEGDEVNFQYFSHGSDNEG